MWLKLAKIILGFSLKCASGFVFAFIFCESIGWVTGTLLTYGGVTGGATAGCVTGANIFVGIPVGAVLGIFLVDKLILRIAVLKRQIITGLVVGVAVSVSLAILDSHGVQIFDRLPHDSLDSRLGGFGIFYIVCILAALLGYTIAGLTKRKTTSEAIPPKRIQER